MPLLFRLSTGSFTMLALIFGGANTRAQSKKNAATRPALSVLTSRDGHFEIKYPPVLIRCERRDGENPDVWSPEHGCAAAIPVCDNAGHSGEVLACVAYPLEELRGAELQGAALSISRLDGFSTPGDCAKRWPNRDTHDIHPERIGVLGFQSATVAEAEGSHVAERSLYRIFHQAACYELDLTLTIALPSAFAAEDTPRKLTDVERKKIKSNLIQALRGFHFQK